MAGPDVLITFDQLQTLDSNLTSIMKELADCSDRADALEDAIDKPFDQSKLRDRAHDFESGWKNRRNDLARDLEKVAKHVHGVVEGFKEWDAKTGHSLQSSGSASGSTSGPK